jgi:branched-chain amino acid transport system ATP-binding protein
VVSVVGSNGAGKTTILNTISGLLRPISGEIRFDGIRIDQTETHHIVRYGIIQVPEGRGLFQNMTVLENLKLGAINPEAKKDFSESLGYVLGLFPILEQRRNQMAGTLSGGEQQMLALGRGLMAKPKLLMMDEPSLGLAPLAIKSVFESIDMLSQKGLAILLVEQNVYHSLSRCDQGYVLQNGRILLAGPGRDILENDYVKKAYLGM